MIPQSTSTTSTPITSLYTFQDSNDYVFDVKWNPVHPSIFGCVDGSGVFDLYNLNREFEVPVCETVVGATSSTSMNSNMSEQQQQQQQTQTQQSQQQRALNKLQFDNEGKRVGIASCDGNLWVYDVSEIVYPQGKAIDVGEELDLLRNKIGEIEGVGVGF